MILLGLLAFFGLLVIAGSTYQMIATARDKRAYPPPGQMVDIGDRRIHMLVQGEDNGLPPVILEAGMASFSSNWYWVQTDLAKIPFNASGVVMP